MNWSAKAAWLYAGNQPDWGKVAKYGIQVIYIDPRDAIYAKQLVADIRNRGLTPGAYVATSWYVGTSEGFGDYVSFLANSVIPKGSLAEAPPLMLDLETVPIYWAAAIIREYRKHQPARPTAYTNEPFKDSTVVPTVIMQQANLHWYVQLYQGDMTAVDPAAAMMQVARIYPPNMVHPFYDGARWGTDHKDGCYFTLERMP
jgi:hypothetical protein